MTTKVFNAAGFMWELIEKAKSLKADDEEDKIYFKPDREDMTLGISTMDDETLKIHATAELELDDLNTKNTEEIDEASDFELLGVFGLSKSVLSDRIVAMSERKKEN